MTATQHPRRLSRPYIVASTLTLLLTVVAAGVGLFVPEFYWDAEVLLPQLYGQDLLMLVIAVPILAGALYYAYQGSLRVVTSFGSVSPATFSIRTLRMHCSRHSTSFILSTSRCSD